MSLRASALLSGAIASSRSRNTASAAEAIAFSAIFRRVAGTARRERGAFMLLVEECLYGLCAQRGVKDLHGVGHRKAVPAHLLQRGLYLKHATGVGGDDHLRPGLQDIVRLALTELGGGLGLDHVVDARGPAADLGLTDLLDVHPRYLLECLARLLADSLRVRQVAGVVVGRRNRQRITLSHGAEFLKELRDITDLRAESLRPLCVLRVVAQQVTVLLHRRATTCGVDDDVVQVQLLEGVYGLAGEVQGLLLAARVGGEGAATTLLGGHNFAALGGQNADRGGVDCGEEDPLDAARQDTDPATLLAYRACEVRDLLFSW